jgi:hypothetical protein
MSEAAVCDYCGEELCYVYSTKHGNQKGINTTLNFCDKKCAVNFCLEDKEARKWLKQEGIF